MANQPDLYLKNGLIATEQATFPGGVVVHRGKIAQVVFGEAEVEAAEVVDLGGRVLLPGLIDAHVHFNEPGREYWEGYRTGSMAAAAGGVTTVLEMPLNASPPSVDRQKLRHKREAASTESVVDYAHWGGLVDNNLDALEALHDEGVVGFKAFLSESSTDDFRRIDDDLLYAGLIKAKVLGNLVGVHSENQYVTRYLKEQLQAQGRIDRTAWPASRPVEAELEAIRRVLFWAEITGARVHIVHVSIAAGVETVARARQAGARATAETCPHYLFFDLDDFVRIGPVAKCAPPIRERREVEALWARVLDVTVDMIASDHSPCPLEDKLRGNDDIWQAWGGISGIQAMLPVLLTEGVHKRGLNLPALVRLTSANPARIFGLYPNKGAILPGADADFVVVDPDRQWTLTADQLLSKHKHSPYLGCRFIGAVERTIVRGMTVYRDGEIRVGPGFGQLVYPTRRASYSAVTARDRHLRATNSAVQSSREQTTEASA